MTEVEKLKKIMNDPVLWIETFVNIVNKQGQIVPFKLNPEQKYLLRNMDKYNIICKSRQLGITSASLSYSLWIAMTQPNSTCMIMSYCEKGVTEIFEKLKTMVNYLPECIKIPTVKDNRSEIKFANNSRIINCVCSGKDNARGATLKFVHLSEVAFMNENLDNQLTAIKQALVPGGSMILESTANGLNRFSELWNQATSGTTPLWKPFFFSWVNDKQMFADEYKEYKKVYKSFNKRYLKEDDLDEKEKLLLSKGATLDQLMWRRIKIKNDGEEKFCQEFPSNPLEAFVSTGTNVFDPNIIAQNYMAIDATKTKKLPKSADPILKKYERNLSIWRLPEKKKKYFLGVDTSEGLGGENDYSVICVMDEHGFQCAEYRSNSIKPYDFTELVYKMGKFYSNGLLIVERASAGHIVVDRLKNDYRYTNMYKYREYDIKGRKGQRKPGWLTTNTSKPIMISDLQEAFETNQILINSQDLLKEMKLFTSNGNGKMQAASGHDDCVLAVAMCLQGIKSGQYFYSFDR